MFDSEFTDYGTVFGADEHRRLAEVFHRLPCPALMAVGRSALTLELYGADIVGEYVRHYNINVRRRISISNMHLVVRHRISPGTTISLRYSPYSTFRLHFGIHSHRSCTLLRFRIKNCYHISSRGQPEKDKCWVPEWE